MKAVILAAGVGSRIRPLTDNKPKSLLPVGNKSILERMLDNIEDAGIKDVVVISGYLEEQIKNFVKKFSNLNFTFVRNDIYAETNTGYSLLLARKFVEGDDFVKFDADVVFESKILKKLIECPVSALCIDRNINLDAEEVKVRVDENGKIVEVGKSMDPKLALGESIGIEKINSNAGGVLFSELESLMKDRANYSRYYDDSYPTIVKAGLPMEAVDITGLKWVEIDTHEDYELALEMFTLH